MDLLFIPRWRAIAVRGAFALFFGLGAFLWPSVSLAGLVLLFGVYALLDGIVAIVVGSRLHATDRRWLLPLEGLLGVAIGLLAIMWAGAETILMTTVIAGWALVTGALELMAAARLRRDIPGEPFLAFGGFASIALGALLVALPRAGSLVLVFLLGSYALAFGSAMLMLALHLRDGEQRARATSHASPRGAPRLGH